MLTELFPRAHVRYTAPPLLGTIADGFAAWLVRQGYSRWSLRRQLRALQRIDRHLRCRRRLRQLREVTRAELRTCAAAAGARDPQLVSTAHAVERYLAAEHALPLPPPEPPTRTVTLLERYATYLHEVRGLQPVTRRPHLRSAAELLAHLTYEDTPARLAALTASDLEAFVTRCGRRLSRATLQHTVAQLRAFLRFLGVQGVLRSGLETQLDTPRCYRGEQLPRALPWPTVRAFLRAIDRTARLGLRDYTMFFLIATYGLRASEIVALTLDDLDWRGNRLRVPPGKSGTPRLLPLTDTAGAVLLRYLRRGRPRLPYRELFLRGRAPIGVLKPTAVTDAFQKWVRRSGLDIPWQGPHCLRHSYAVHLLRRGVALKTIGDLLGHRIAESTCAYLRLAVDDLRGVALAVPPTRAAVESWERRS